MERCTPGLQLPKRRNELPDPSDPDVLCVDNPPDDSYSCLSICLSSVSSGGGVPSCISDETPSSVLITEPDEEKRCDESRRRLPPSICDELSSIRRRPSNTGHKGLTWQENRKSYQACAAYGGQNIYKIFSARAHRVDDVGQRLLMLNGG